MQMLAFLLARFSEPSSYAGLGAMLALLGVHFSDSDLGQLAEFLAGGCGLAALLLKERGMIPVIVVALVLGGTVGACAPLVAAGSVAGAAGGGLAIANRVVVTADDTIATACGEYGKSRAAAEAVVGTGLVPGDAAAKVSAVEQFGDAACANPPQGDPVSTAIWLGELIGQIGTLSSVAAAGS
jgi:hypothetical protein